MGAASQGSMREAWREPRAGTGSPSSVTIPIHAALYGVRGGAQGRKDYTQPRLLPLQRDLPGNEEVARLALQRPA